MFTRMCVHVCMYIRQIICCIYVNVRSISLKVVVQYYEIMKYCLFLDTFLNYMWSVEGEINVSCTDGTKSLDFTREMFTRERVDEETCSQRRTL